MPSLRPIAIYLPQYHPIPENDEWWGKGFTEWTNVTKAKPLFEGHYQPHLPADLGFYDLRVPEVREAQAALAKAHGIYGFCYYHYWFNGRRILERPFQEVFESGKPDFPFMLCWANENWTRTWDGGDKTVLLEQQYSLGDDLNHIRSLLPVFADSRYIKIDGKCVFAVYRSSKIPDVKRTIELWRREALTHKIELYLCRVESFGEAGKHYLEEGFDAAIQFEPISSRYYKFQHSIRKSLTTKSWTLDYIKFRLKTKAAQDKYLKNRTSIVSYKEYVNYLVSQPWTDEYKYFPCITPMWDNTARRKFDPIILDDASPEAYRQWLSYILNNFSPPTQEENLLFINAWNEWAEGNHLEPCQKWGMSYLEATKDELASFIVEKTG